MVPHVRKYEVRVTPDAISDIEELASFYLELVDEVSAERFIEDVLGTLKNLDTFPQSNTYFDEEHGLRRIQLRYHKVSVVYVVDDGVYEVIAFAVFQALREPNSYTCRLT
ncbi:type II toxin-antitoxin system RelE/ParE family toxin [Bifidobacterium crudilactis]|jgi:plasmid stabilization system protein ParE|uniref:type II toxin-antitoxin system RelE/ParE family toxin n=1 Tax=Bifidobacterium crudilactis TaxID=327277 RepID=UPI002F357214